jgi:1,4-dihydroxy-2-naphthoate octaprenyltransferase
MADRPPANTFLLFVWISRPLFLVAGVLTYALGAGVANYLGVTIHWTTYLTGQVWVIAVQLAGVYLFEYYNAVFDQENLNTSQNPNGKGHPQASRPPVTMLVASAVCLTAVASLSVYMIRELRISPATLALMILMVVGAVFYSVPPVRLAFTGYGELSMAILVANLVPAFAYSLQVGDLHRLLAMGTFPLTALLIALFLAFELEAYAGDVRQNRRNLLVRMGWQRGMVLHNGLILSAYLLFGFALSFGLPLLIALPAFLPLPLGFLQIWQMRRIADGGRPNWLSLKLTAATLFATTAYLLTFTFWTR